MTSPNTVAEPLIYIYSTVEGLNALCVYGKTGTGITHTIQDGPDKETGLSSHRLSISMMFQLTLRMQVFSIVLND